MLSHKSSMPDDRTKADTDDVWIVVPAYNEEERIGTTLNRLCASYSNIVVIDDGSQDATVEVAMDYPVWVLQHALNLGAGAATQTGVSYALQHGAEVLVTFDADGQHEVKDIPSMIGPILEGEVDVTLGSRFIGQFIDMPWTRWLVLKLGVLFTRIVSQIQVTDTHNGLRAMSRKAAERIQIVQNRMSHCSEFLDKVREYELPYREVPVTIFYSNETLAKGQSSWNAFRIVSQFLLGRLVK